jgi:CBS domain containing-hemolysin-like protein
VSPGVWILVSLLIAANAFYVAAEFGAVGVRRSRVRRMSEDGHMGARLLLPHVQQSADLNRYVAASQVGITMSSLILGAVGQSIAAVSVAPYLASWAGFDPRTAATAAAGIILFILTAVQVVIGELVPKSIALSYPTEVAIATVLPMRWSLAAFKPLIKFLDGTATGLLRLFGITFSGHRHLHSPDEIALLFAESRDGGLLEPDEQQRLQKALRLSRQTARDLMVPRERLKVVNAESAWLDALQEAAATPYSRLPVYRGSPDHIVGMLRVKDLVRRYVTEGPPESIAPLVRAVVKVPHDLPGDQVIARLRDKRAHQAAVVDGTDAIIGFVTIQDVLAQFLGPRIKPS